nr:MAG TPA: cytochrome C-like protein [Caudoviricetes sp.]
MNCFCFDCHRVSLCWILRLQRILVYEKILSSARFTP